MRRTRLRAALLVVVAATLGGIGYLVSRSVSSRRANPLRGLVKDLLPQVAQRIQNFHRVKVEKGRSIWEITAVEAQYFERQNEIVVREPHMTFFLEGDTRQTHVSGSEGHILLDGGEVRSLTLRGRVVVQLDDLELQTDEITYDQSSDLITSPGIVTLRGRTLEVRGHGLEVAVGPQQVRLLDDIHTTVRSDATTS